MFQYWQGPFLRRGFDSIYVTNLAQILPVGVSKTVFVSYVFHAVDVHIFEIDKLAADIRVDRMGGKAYNALVYVLESQPVRSFKIHLYHRSYDNSADIVEFQILFVRFHDPAQSMRIRRPSCVHDVPRARHVRCATHGYLDTIYNELRVPATYCNDDQIQAEIDIRPVGVMKLLHHVYNFQGFLIFFFISLSR